MNLLFVEMLDEININLARQGYEPLTFPDSVCKVRMQNYYIEVSFDNPVGDRKLIIDTDKVNNKARGFIYIGPGSVCHRNSEEGPAFVEFDEDYNVVRAYYKEVGRLHRPIQHGPASFARTSANKLETIYCEYGVKINV